MEMTSTLDGYWMDAARIMIMNERVPEKMMKAYDNLVAMRKKAVEKLKPGTRCSEVFTTVKEEAKKRGVEIVEKLGIGHGVGVTPYEAPYLIEGDNTVLKAGMIMILDPVIYGPDGEIMRLKDMILITDTGCKILGWYKNWKEPYIPAYTL